MRKTAALRRRLFWLVAGCLAVAAIGLAWRSMQKARLNGKLVAAIRRNDSTAVRWCLSQGADANATGSPYAASFWTDLTDILFRRHSPENRPVLFLAIEAAALHATQPFRSGGMLQDDATVVKLLLDHGANPNARLLYGFSHRRPMFGVPLDIAIHQNLTHVATALAQHGARPDRVCLDQPTLLIPVQNNNPALLKIVLDASGLPDKQTGEQALEMVCQAAGNPFVSYSDQLKMLQMLLDAGVDPNTAGNNTPPLRQAVIRQQYDVVRLLLQHKADPNLAPPVGDLPLLWYALDDKLQMLRMLLDAGADPNTLDKKGTGDPILWYAILHSEPLADKVQKVRLLLDHGADPMLPMPNVDRHPPLLRFAEQHASEWLIEPRMLALLKQAATKRLLSYPPGTP